MDTRDTFEGCKVLDLDPYIFLVLPSDFNPERDLGIDMFENSDQPISPLAEAELQVWSDLKWKQLPINNEHDRHDEDVADISDRILYNPVYHNEGCDGAREKVFLRVTTACSLLLIDNALKTRDLRVLVWDGWRSPETQNHLFQQFKHELRKKHSDISDEELSLMTQKYVSLPTEHPFHPSPHITGGAIDWTICDMEGNPINMGCEFDDFTDIASTRYFEDLDRPLTPNEEEARDNRRLHYWLSKNAGLGNYPFEFWHSSRGDQMWSLATGKEAYYGPAPFAVHDTLVDPLQKIEAVIGGVRQVFNVNFLGDDNVHLWVPGSLMEEEFEGMGFPHWVRIDYPFPRAVDAMEARRKCQQAERVLYELALKRNLTEEEVRRVIEETTGRKLIDLK